MARRRDLALLLCLGLALFCGLTSRAASAEDFALRSAYADQRPIGPDRARGAVIWSHGKGTEPAAEPDMLPFYVDDLRREGYDAFRLDRAFDVDGLEASPAALADAARKLKTEGYRRIVLAGQSFGAWISLIAADGDAPVDAVIGTAPAAFGRNPASPRYPRNASDLFAMLNQVRRARVMLFFFDQDGYDPGGRGTRAEAILQTRGLAHLIVDRPEGWSGHGAANWRGFARRFGPCIARFADLDAPVDPAGCDADPVTVAQLPLPLPSEAERAADRHDLTGIWYGVFPNGREVVLAVEADAKPGTRPTATLADTGARMISGDGDAVRALYAWGPRERDEERYGSMMRVGHLAGGRLVFDEKGLPQITALPRADGALDLAWTSPDGGERASALLRKLAR